MEPTGVPAGWETYGDEQEGARRLLHRHVGLHRLQGLRGRVQGVEPDSRGRPRLDRRVVRPHLAARREHVAPRRLRRAAQAAASASGRRQAELRWLMESDVCKHCTHAACLDVCPTGSLFRTEFGTVVVQQDICNGCGYCVPACPFGVLDKRHLAPGPRPAGVRRRRTAGSGSARSATTGSRAATSRHARRRAPRSRSSSGRSTSCGSAPTRGSRSSRPRAGTGRSSTAAIPSDGVGGFGAFFLLLDEPEVYGLPPDPVVTTRDLPEMWTNMLAAAGALLAGVTALTLLGGRR